MQIVSPTAIIIFPNILFLQSRTIYSTSSSKDARARLPLLRSEGGTINMPHQSQSAISVDTCGNKQWHHHKQSQRELGTDKCRLLGPFLKH